jgi:hypothetical protein
MFEEQKKYRVITARVNENVLHNDFKTAVYKETHEGPMQSFDGSPFEPATYPFDLILEWFKHGGGEIHGYDWEVTEA